MADTRIKKFAKILVEHSANIQSGDRVAIEATTAAEPLIRELICSILEHGGHPHLLLALPDQEELLFKYGNDAQISYVNEFRKFAYENFESRIRIHSLTNTRALSNIDAKRQKVYQSSLSPILKTQMARGAQGLFKWVTTLYPTEAFAMEANMGLHEYEDFVFRAVHASDEFQNPIESWKILKTEQEKFIQLIEGHDQVTLEGPNINIKLSVKGRKFNNSYGKHNMPDGEIYTGPVENSINGWIKFTYPAISQGRVVEGIELTFKDGQVESATSRTNQEFLLQMLATDAGARYVGEFAIGTNYQINRFTGHILFDEKIGGTIHMALGAGYPETGSVNKSMIHWDMICDMRTDSQILADGELIYKNGNFVI